MTPVIGIDAGGTKTLCVLADPRGEVLRTARGPGANLQTAGEAAIRQTLERLLSDVLAAGLAAPSAVCIGMAGVDRQTETSTVRRILQAILTGPEVLVVNDALIALVAGVGAGPGIVVVAGTGSIAYGRNARNEAARAGGWGSVLGDEGSGYWMGRQALRAVVREADGRSRPTRLSPKVLAQLGLERPDELIHAAYRRKLQASDIAALAPSVQQAFAEGDHAARAIVERAAQELSVSALSVARRLGMLDSPFPLVLSGSVVREMPALVAELGKRLAPPVSGAQPRVLDVEPAIGAARLAADLAAGRLRLPGYLAP